jgi:hypothetical protein
MNTCNPITAPMNRSKSAPPTAPKPGCPAPRYRRHSPDADRAFDDAVRWFLALARTA